MANDTLVNVALSDPLGSIGWIIQAIGGVVVISFILGIVNVVLNRKRIKELNKIREDLKEIKGLLSRRRNNY